ncbi:hypothetical protein F5Y14DRAFT_147772 [Nemania sp. NC0429]|nr:hypothetical protein F5Y14DRAFT_147772 [Nemania sp. NC0429]
MARGLGKLMGQAATCFLHLYVCTYVMDPYQVRCSEVSTTWPYKLSVRLSTYRVPAYLPNRPRFSPLRSPATSLEPQVQGRRKPCHHTLRAASRFHHPQITNNHGTHENIFHHHSQFSRPRCTYRVCVFSFLVPVLILLTTLRVSDSVVRSILFAAAVLLFRPSHLDPSSSTSSSILDFRSPSPSTSTRQCVSSLPSSPYPRHTSASRKALQSSIAKFDSLDSAIANCTISHLSDAVTDPQN